MSTKPKTKSKRSAGMSTPARVALMICVSLCCMWIGAVSGRPFVLAARMRADNNTLDRRSYDIRHQNQELRKEAASLTTDAGMERAARNAGYMKPGEIPLLLTPGGK